MQGEASTFRRRTTARLLSTLAVGMALSACAEPLVEGVFDAGREEAIRNAMTGEVPELDGLTPAISAREGTFPVVLTQCIELSSLPPDRSVEYTASRQWSGTNLSYSDVQDLSLDLDDFSLDSDGCFEVPVARASVPAPVLEQVNSIGEPVEVSVVVEIAIQDPRTVGVQNFQPFWIVPD